MSRVQLDGWALTLRRATRSALHAVVVESDASRSVSRILSPPAVGDGHPSWMPVARHLVRSDPGPGTSSPWTPRRPPLFDLAPDGVYLAGRSPDRRWALTPPFHRCRDREGRGCVLSVALSFGSPRLDVIQRPALWSPDFPQAANRPRPSDRLARRVYPRDAAPEMAGPTRDVPMRGWGGGGSTTRRARPTCSVGKGHLFRLTGVHPF